MSDLDSFDFALDDEDEYGTTAGHNSGDGKKVEQEFTTIAEFVDGVIIKLITRDSGEYFWLPTWFDYPEVVERLEHLWRDYELARAQEESMTGWWLYRFDPTWAVLTSRFGPMGIGEPREPLRAAIAPDGHRVHLVIEMKFATEAPEPSTGGAPVASEQFENLDD
ncbi:DUF4913 domain-containing protein [Tsukamurella paurometabola]|uniref:DUF4913 domain-containing protein n=1 Tax=Tsukamurella paurometabola (strain ATCC 8368 / DSM 20162 / CCUG 35730 / CIP 100753 / JCM 10117 / KCTC 9821 / NBRC 16120 / NCIMB 702349 / NCTC 13040) TaxID=521096 RepID=D5UQT1_TSUPD|nr:DUF4913 domain-containing protein [Tsukamurella paurometabola]ADG76914.1 hypothetical protein Tpau_0264 [Tsukamurella paurometabola DSM 20162]SUP42182.1 Uncharacterised protein [Tsukamurella paurometabola]